MRKSALKKMIPYVLVAVGTVLVLAAVGMEAFQYPWRTLFSAKQSANSVPDPTPIILKGEDSGSSIQESGDIQSANNETNEKTLPGNENGEKPEPVYTQLGILKIPKLNISQFILEGTERQMHYGVGHVIGTAGMGAQGNCAIAGHNTTAFRYLYKLTAGDIIILESNNNVYTYTVYNSFKVLPDETWVLSDVPGEEKTLTLITCTPYLVSSHRLIVRARLTDVNGTSSK